MLKQCPNLAVNPIGDETIIYDLSTDRASNLNVSASKVFALCDGTVDFEGVCQRLAESMGAEGSEAVVREALDMLMDKGLVSGLVPAIPPTRREFLKKVLVTTAVALPVIYSVMTPAAYAARSV